MTDERKEAADIARSVRRYIERERVSNTADLLADGATRAVRAGTRTAQGPGALRGESKPAWSQGPAEAGFASARAGRMPAPSGREAPPGLAPSAPAPSGREVSPGLPPSAPEPSVLTSAPTNLFGEPEPAPAKAQKKSVEALLDEPLPEMFAEGLSPAGLNPRANLATASMPVLETIAQEVRACTKCGLCDTRTQAVPGVGSAKGGIVFVGEAPGADEDRLGEPFVGRAGQLLDKIIKAMDDARLIPGLPLNRDTIFICNVLKCRPPENRNPLPHEIELCSPYLRRQLEAIQPRIICCLGKFAAELLVGVKGTIAGLRGKVYRYQGAKLIVTYHPAACLRNPDYKRPVWEDMQLLAREYLSD